VSFICHYVRPESSGDLHLLPALRYSGSTVIRAWPVVTI